MNFARFTGFDDYSDTSTLFSPHQMMVDGAASQ